MSSEQSSSSATPWASTVPIPAVMPNPSSSHFTYANPFPVPFHIQQQQQQQQSYVTPSAAYAPPVAYAIPTQYHHQATQTYVAYRKQQQSYVAPSAAYAPPVAYAIPSQYHHQATQTYVAYRKQQQSYVAPPAAYAIPTQYHHQATAHQLFQRDAQAIRPEALENVKAALANSESEKKAETKKKAIPRKAAGQNWEDPTLAEWPENDFRIFCGDLGNEVNDDVLSKAFSRFPSYNMARVIRDKRTGKTKGYGFVSFANPTDLAAAIKEMNGKYVGNRPIKLRKSNWKERTDLEALEKQKNHFNRKGKFSKKANK